MRSGGTPNTHRNDVACPLTTVQSTRRASMQRRSTFVFPDFRHEHVKVIAAPYTAIAGLAGTYLQRATLGPSLCTDDKSPGISP